MTRPEHAPDDRDLALDALEPVTPATEGELIEALARATSVQREHDRFMDDIYRKRNEEWSA